MTEQKTKQNKPHNLIMSNCEKMNLSGVFDVESFDDKTVVCYTDFGKLVIRGDSLHVDNMNVDSGDMEITGRVRSLFYADEAPTRSLFSKLFK